MKKLKLLLAIGFIPLCAMAQDAQDSIKTKIREIKLSERYVYAEAVTPNDITEGQQNSLDLLHAHVAGMLADKLGKSKKESDRIWDEVQNRCQNMTVKNGDLFRVFTYIPKSCLFPGEAEPNEVPEKPVVAVEVEEATEPIAVSVAEQSTDITPDTESIIIDSIAEPSVVASVVEQASVTPVEPAEPVTEGAGGEVKQVNQGEAEVAVSSDPVAVPADTQDNQEEKDKKTAELVGLIATPVESKPVMEEKPVEVESIEAIPADIPNPSPTNALEALPESARTVIEEMLVMKTYKEAIAYLDQMKDKGKLVYGRVKTMSSPEKSYLLVTNKGELVTILDKGKHERINLKTNATDSLKNYKGQSIIWFQIF